MKKKPYLSPTVTEVQLLPEEGVLTVCRGTSANTSRGCASCRTTRTAATTRT